MKINVNHPQFISFVETIIGNVKSNVGVGKYYNLTTEKKSSLQYLTFKLINQTVRSSMDVEETQLLTFIKIMRKKTEANENYELSGLLSDLENKFDGFMKISKNSPPIKVKPKED